MILALVKCIAIKPGSCHLMLYSRGILYNTFIIRSAYPELRYISHNMRKNDWFFIASGNHPYLCCSRSTHLASTKVLTQVL